MDRDVVDQTGMTGLFDIHLDVAIDQLLVQMGIESQPSDGTPLSASEPAGTIPAALRKLGLQLQAGKKTHGGYRHRSRGDAHSELRELPGRRTLKMDGAAH